MAIFVVNSVENEKKKCCSEVTVVVYNCFLYHPTYEWYVSLLLLNIIQKNVL